MVTQVNDCVYVVDLEAQVYDCGHFQKNRIPCGHAFSFIFELKGRSWDYVPYMFTITAWGNTYKSNL